MPNAQQYTIDCSFWIKATDGHFLGKGRVELLEHIAATGSITNAARAMKMSYRQAWQMVQDMNARSAEPLVEKTLGGAGGGGAKVTKEGERLILLYRNLAERINKFIADESAKLNG